MMKEDDPALNAASYDVWRCIGCGRIEGPQPCIGVCEDRKARLVDFSDYAAVVSRLDDATDRIAALESVVRRIALIRPRNGEWERTYRALQAEARAALGGPKAAQPLRSGEGSAIGDVEA
jgi:hypothetical protein